MEIMKDIKFALAGAFVLGMMSCSSDEPGTGEDKGKDVPNPYVKIEMSRGEARVAESGYGFAWNLFGKANVERPGENLCLSPLSANIALTMLLNGAEGSTLDEITNVLGLTGMSVGEINENSQFLVKEVMTRDNGCTLSSANSLWISGDFSVKESFKLTLKNYYRATASNTTKSNFSKDVNAWCNEHTNGLIPKLMNDGESYDWALLNALYYENIWAKGIKFESVGNKEFTNFDGTKSKPSFMKAQDIMCRYTETQYGRHAHVPFGNYAYYMSITLPNEEVNLEQCIDELQGNIDNFRGAWDAEVTITMPKFEINTNYELDYALKALGMKKAFEATAQFPYISDVNTFVKKVKQSSYVKVDEKGAKASVVTSIGGWSTSVNNPHPEPMVVDRPFIFTIYESSTNCILFVGKIEML